MTALYDWEAIRTEEHDRRLTKLETQMESLRHERKA